MLTVSSTYASMFEGHMLNVEKITDGRLDTFWSSNLNDNPSKVTYALNAPQTITQVTVGVRLGSSTYKKIQ